MTDREAIERGFRFEKEVADLLGGQTQPGSGNKFYAKGDCVANGLSISCKSQNRFYWPEIKEYLKDSIEDSFGTGSIGILVLDDLNGEKGYSKNNSSDQYIVMDMNSFIKAFSDEIKIENSKESKGLEKRKKADIPLMLR